MVDIICRGADASASNVGFAQNIAPDLAGALFGLYLFGDAHAWEDATKDYSGHNRHLTTTGAPVINDFDAVFGADAYMATPFTPAQLAAGGGMTIIAVARDLSSYNGSGSIMPFISSNNAAGVVSSVIYGDRTTTPKSMKALAKMPTSITASLNADAHYGTGPEFYAGAFADNFGRIYRRFNGFAQSYAESTSATIDAPAGALPFCFGSQNGQTNNGNTCRSYAAAFYSRVLTAGEIESVYLMMHDYFGDLSTPLVI